MKDYIESKIISLVNETKEELIARLLNKIEYHAPHNKETRKAYGGSKRRCEFVDLASLQSVESAKIALTSLGGVELANVEEAAKKEFVTKI